LGQALEWSKLDYAAQKLAMESACLDALDERQGRMRDKKREANAVRVKIDRSEVLFFGHAMRACATDQPRSDQRSLGRPQAMV
jgi:hypothetical protein